jgi:hypothetical protein
MRSRLLGGPVRPQRLSTLRPGAQQPLDFRVGFGHLLLQLADFFRVLLLQTRVVLQHVLRRLGLATAAAGWRPPAVACTVEAAAYSQARAVGLLSLTPLSVLWRITIGSEHDPAALVCAATAIPLSRAQPRPQVGVLPQQGHPQDLGADVKVILTPPCIFH